MAKPDKMLNEVPVAFVLATGEQEPTKLQGQIEGACERSLADFKRPREVRIVDALPRANLEKIAKAKLREKPIEEAG